MDNNDTIKITYAKNLNKINFNSVLNLPIDSNVNIKTILDVFSYIYDEKVECGSGKAIFTGRIGVRVLYIDMDNITNTITDTQSFSETFVDSSITADTFINASNATILSTVLSSDGTLKINCDVSCEPLLYLNLALPNNLSNIENMIVKKSEIETSTISQIVQSSFEYTVNLESKDRISKILCYNAYFCPNNVVAYDEYATVEGKLYSRLVYEYNADGESEIKEKCEISNIKSEISMPGLNRECTLDLNFKLDCSKENISTDIEEENSVITILHSISVSGVATKKISLDIVDDMYSTDNEIELNMTTREYNNNLLSENVEDSIVGELSLQNEDTAIDEVVSNLNIKPEITNIYIKDETVYIEGLISSNVVYIDENKELKKKPTEIPFVTNTKIKLDKLDCYRYAISVSDCRIKAKRGTILEFEYAVCVNLYLYHKETRQIIDNISIGKAIDFSAYDYQIYLAKPNESMWELCKRIKCAPEEIARYNRELPLVMEGGEKVIIKR